MKSVFVLILGAISLANVSAFRSAPLPRVVPTRSLPTKSYPCCHLTSNKEMAPLNPRSTLLCLEHNSNNNCNINSNNSFNNHHYEPSNHRFPTKTAAILGSTAVALAALPHMASALDLASLSITKTAWWASLAETGFYQAFSLVFVSEIGDKTFFIAGILGAKAGRLLSFVGSVAALAVMTIVSVGIGQVFHAVPSGFADGIPLDDVAAALAFAFFGYKTLKEALDMDPNQQGGGVMDEELAEAEEAVQETGISAAASKLGILASIFGLVFAAEFGDRSFLSTIALSAAQNPVSVAGGAIAAHAVATGIAVAGGSYISKYISERVIGITGGVLFLVFAVTTALGIF